MKASVLGTYDAVIGNDSGPVKGPTMGTAIVGLNATGADSLHWGIDFRSSPFRWEYQTSVDGSTGWIDAGFTDGSVFDASGLTQGLFYRVVGRNRVGADVTQITNVAELPV